MSLEISLHSCFIVNNGGNGINCWSSSMANLTNMPELRDNVAKSIVKRKISVTKAHTVVLF